MLSLASDQAEGLRRLFRRRSARMIAVVAGCGGVGRTSATVNYATALAAQGRRVLVIDENTGPGNVTDALRAPAQADLLAVLKGGCDLDEAVCAAPCGIAVLPAAEAAQATGGLDREGRERLATILARLAERFDLILVDALVNTAGVLLRDVRGARDCVVVCSGGYAAITASYSLVKRLSGSRDPHCCHLLLNRITDERSARVIFENLERLAKSRLNRPLNYLGCIARDESLQRAARMRQPVVAAFPSAPAAQVLARGAASLASSTAEPERAGSLDRLLHMFRGRPLTLINAGA